MTLFRWRLPGLGGTDPVARLRKFSEINSWDLEPKFETEVPTAQILKRFRWKAFKRPRCENI